MKKSLYIAILVSFSLLPACRQEKQTSSTVQTSQQTVQFIQKEPSYDSLLPKILELQIKISTEPKNDSLKTKLLKLSFDTGNGCFYLAGTGIHNKKFPAGTQNVSKKRAANLIAERWALYLKLWQDGSMVPFGTSVSGTIAYSKIVLEKECGDTLFMLQKIPRSSIYLQ